MAASVGEVHCGIVRYTCNGFIPQRGIIFVSASTGKLSVLKGIVPVPARYCTSRIKPVLGQNRDVCWVSLTRIRLS